MRKSRRAIAIAKTQHHPLHITLAPIHAVFELMYGTPKRTRMTMMFAFLLLIAGGAMNFMEVYAQNATCAVGG